MVVSARNLPVTKTMSKSADTYVEVSLNSLFTENAAEGEGAEELLQEDVCNNHVNACTRSSTTTQVIPEIIDRFSSFFFNNCYC